MSRELKFRLVLNGKAVGYEWHKLLTIGDGHIEVFHSEDGNEWHNITANPYCFIEHDDKRQYTGLKDKNGVEIYEGDIFGKREELRAVVEQEEDGRWVVRFVDKRIPKMSITVRLIRESEVIGNIYENPELLEVSQ